MWIVGLWETSNRSMQSKTTPNASNTASTAGCPVMVSVMFEFFFSTLYNARAPFLFHWIGRNHSDCGLQLACFNQPRAITISTLPNYCYCIGHRTVGRWRILCLQVVTRTNSVARSAFMNLLFHLFHHHLALGFSGHNMRTTGRHFESQNTLQFNFYATFLTYTYYTFFQLD